MIPQSMIIVEIYIDAMPSCVGIPYRVMCKSQGRKKQAKRADQFPLTTSSHRKEKEPRVSQIPRETDVEAGLLPRMVNTCYLPPIQPFWLVDNVSTRESTLHF